MKNNLLTSILLSIYLIYMFLFFKTSIDFNIILGNFCNNLFLPKGKFFQHLVGNEKGLRICPFGRVAIFALILILIGRHFFKISKKTINIVLFISFILSLMNMNALVYLVPVYLSIHIIE
jgi:hypothetical protein